MATNSTGMQAVIKPPLLNVMSAEQSTIIILCLYAFNSVAIFTCYFST